MEIRPESGIFYCTMTLAQVTGDDCVGYEIETLGIGHGAFHSSV